MESAGGDSRNQLVARARVFGMPKAPLSADSQLALRSSLQGAGVSVTSLDVDRPVLEILFAVAGPTSQAAAEALIWRAVVRCFPDESMGSLGKVEVKCQILSSSEAPTVTMPPALPSPWRAAWAMWIPAGVTLLTGLYFMSREPALASAAPPAHETTGEVHVTADEKKPGSEAAGWIPAAEWEAVSRLTALIHCEEAKVGPAACSQKSAVDPAPPATACPAKGQPVQARSE
jgi:hypothetical protein